MSDYNGNNNQNSNGYNNSNNDNKGQNGGGKNTPPKRQNLLLLVIAALLTLLVMSFFMKNVSGGSEQEISYDKFVSMLDKKEVKSVNILSDRIEIVPVEGAEVIKDPTNIYAEPVLDLFGTAAPVQKIYYTGISESGDQLTERLIKAGAEINPEIPDNSGLLFSILITYVLPIILVYFLISFFYRRMSGGGGPMGV